ncbi:DUF2913 family protein [Vibrio vulnificus]|nr:DUF2913 family protein [Vibrio vulnificus]RZP71908.1 DUF2913 family protein [Vibrio vulnificus]RZP73086.1 DUF2913 family protein [Vibrio vulnificus]
MSNYQYERLLSTTVDNALLHLWLSAAISKHYLPRESRNHILVKWIKPKVKLAKYRLIKKELKSMVQAGKERNSNLEARLCELSDLSRAYREKITDIHKLHYLLEHLREEHGISADLSDGVTEHQPGTLYIEQRELETCFSEDKRQLKPILITLSQINIENFSRIVREFGFHEIMRGNNEQDNTSTTHLHCVKANSVSEV